MITASAKSKGRRLQQYVRDSILTLFQEELTPADVSSNPMGCAGCDVVLSTRARELFPYAVECKNCESWTIPASKNRQEALVILRYTDYLELIYKCK
jgi:hypothetical protein